jgi:hypothetical protein
MLDSSDRNAYVTSLELLASLHFDVLVPWATAAGAAAFERVDPEEGSRRLLAIADRLRAGGDH